MQKSKNLIVITSPSLDPLKNVSGISSMTHFIITNNKKHSYVHFQIGKTDGEHSSLLRIWRTVICLIKWIKLLLLSKRDLIIHYNFPLSNFSIIRDSVFIFCAYLFRKKIILHIHGGMYLTNACPPFPIDQILKSVLRLNLPTIVLSDKEKSELGNRYKCDTIIVLPNCVSIEPEIDVKEKYIADQSLDLLFMGRIATDKGINYILESVIQLQNLGYLFKLHFAGEEEVKDEYIPRFRTALGERFIYHGVVSGEQKKDLLSHVDVLLLPSFYEGLPMSLLEGMSFGLIPIVTNVGSIGSVVFNRKNGLIVKDHDSTEIIESFILLINNPDLRTELAISARQTIIDHFDVDNYVNQLNAIYKRA